MVDKDINDALKQKLGDIYQYYIAALDFFEIEDVEKIEIEKHGDITIYTPNRLIQKEVKHHIKCTRLNDKHIDFWKTLYNWLVEKNKSSKYSELILHTTGFASKNSVFHNWNDICVEQKYINLLSLPHNACDPAKKNFDYYYSKVFANNDFEKNDIKEVLSKIRIIQGDNIYDIRKSFYKYLVFLDDDNQKDNMVVWIMGYIIKQCTEQSDSWIITKKEFFDDFKKITKLFNEEKSIPDDYMDKNIDSGSFDKYKEYTFVRKIREINITGYCNVEMAINEYWKTQCTIIKYFDTDISTIDRLKKYKSEIDNLLRSSREAKAITINESDLTDIMKKSQMFYYEMMGKEPLNVGELINYSFFQHGVIHTIMDESDIRWYLGEKHED